MLLKINNILFFQLQVNSIGNGRAFVTLSSGCANVCSFLLGPGVRFSKAGPENFSGPKSLILCTVLMTRNQFLSWAPVFVYFESLEIKFVVDETRRAGLWAINCSSTYARLASKIHTRFQTAYRLERQQKIC